MAADTFSVPTSLGEAIGELEGRKHPVTGEQIWHLQHPWGDDHVVGSPRTAKAELRRIVAAFEAEDKEGSL